MSKLRSLLDRIFAGRDISPVRIVDLGTIDGPVYAIGDVHGCRSLMASALAGIARDAGKARPTVILLGDLVDRGPDSAGVLDDLTSQTAFLPAKAVLGNHERMMLSFIEDPLASWDWLQQGGYETLASYGLNLTTSERPGEKRLRQMIAAHIPDHHVIWLKSLPHGYMARIGGARCLFVHAGIDGRRPPDKQNESAVLWGRNVSHPTSDLCIVQGHVIVDAPEVSAHCIRIDTGAYVTGTLSVMRFSPGMASSVMSFRQQTY